MKLQILLVSGLVALVAAGCSKNQEATASAAPAAAAANSQVIKLTGNDAMKFNITTINVKVGEEVTLTLTNVGTMPKQAMAHDFVLLKPGSDAGAFAMAAVSNPGKIPADLAGEVVAHTELLGPGESQTVKFTLTEAGTYPFLCSFPGHYQTGMKGVVIAK